MNMNLGEEYSTYNDIPKRVRNSIQKRIESTVNKYGFIVFRKCANKYINGVGEEIRLQNEIDERTAELDELKKQKKK